MDRLIRKMQKNGVLIDTNLLVLLIVGLVDPKIIETHKRLSAYTKDDFVLLVSILDTCKFIATSPHILAETSNLASNGMYGEAEAKIFLALKGILMQEKFIEIHTTASGISEKEGFLTFGLSDIGLLETLNSEYVLLTDDFRLSGYAEKMNFEVLNFNHLRYSAWS